MERMDEQEGFLMGVLVLFLIGVAFGFLLGWWLM